MSDKFKYTAFISYNHADRAVVKWLHHALETYRVPKDLVGKTTPAGIVPDKFQPFFRDQDELSAAANLTQSIKTALRQSRFLIVVCSPQSAKSPWVEKEIQEFKKLHGQDHILCLLAGDEGGPPAFPKALFKGKSAFEPLAADIRPGGDGKRLAKFKLISGLLGVKLDTLVQREGKRRQIQMAIMAGTFSLTTVVLAVLLYTATQARKEADANRQQAEELVGFMLGDLREKLEPIGNLQMLDSVALRALNYYSSIEPEKMTTEGLQRRSRILLLLGETQALRGNNDAARDAFMKAYQTTGELLKREPENPALIFSYSQTIYWLGFNDLRLKNYASAETYFRDYADKVEAMVKLDPENQGYQAEVGHAYFNLGNVQYYQGKYRPARNDFEKALDVFKQQAAQNDDSVEASFDLGQGYARVADTYLELGEFETAEKLRRIELGTYQALLKDNPDNRAVLGAMAWSYGAIGALTYYRGKEKGSLEFFDQAIAIFQRLVAFDRENTEWKEKLVQVYNDKARSLIAERDYKDAEEILRQTMSLESWLLAINPEFSNWILRDFRTRVLLAEARLKLGKRKEALEMAKVLASDYYQKFPPEDRNSEIHFMSAEILDVLAEAYRRGGDRKAAEENWKKVVRTLEPFEQSGGIAVYTLLPKARKKAG